MLKTVKNILKDDYLEEQEYFKMAKRGKDVHKKSIMLTYFEYTTWEYILIILPLVFLSSDVSLKLAESISHFPVLALTFISLMLSTFLLFRQLKILIDITFRYEVLREEVVSEINEESNKDKNK